MACAPCGGLGLDGQRPERGQRDQRLAGGPGQKPWDGVMEPDPRGQRWQGPPAALCGPLWTSLSLAVMGRSVFSSIHLLSPSVSPSARHHHCRARRAALMCLIREAIT